MMKLMLDKHLCILLYIFIYSESSQTRCREKTFPSESESNVLWLLVGNLPSLLLVLACRRVRLVGGVAGFPQQRGAEDADNAQVEDEADDQNTDGPQEGGHRPVGHKCRPP